MATIAQNMHRARSLHFFFQDLSTYFKELSPKNVTLEKLCDGPNIYESPTQNRTTLQYRNRAVSCKAFFSGNTRPLFNAEGFPYEAEQYKKGMVAMMLKGLEHEELAIPFLAEFITNQLGVNAEATKCGNRSFLFIDTTNWGSNSKDPFSKNFVLKGIKAFENEPSTSGTHKAYLAALAKKNERADSEKEEAVGVTRKETKPHYNPLPGVRTLFI